MSGVGNVGKAKLYRVAPDGLVVYGTPSPGCFGAEVMYGNTTPQSETWDSASRP